MRARLGLTLLVLTSVVPGTPGVALAQKPTGSVSVFADYFPNRCDTIELRSRVFAEEKVEPTAGVRLTLSGFAEGLLARRPEIGGANDMRTETDAILKIMDGKVEVTNKHFDLLAGYARVAWGKLDEIQPTDVVNPLDVSRFFFEGRSEARLPVLLVRARLHVSEGFSIEGLYVPDFRRGRFDQLDEPTSPFNIATAVRQDVVGCQAIGCPVLPLTVVDRQPPLTWKNAQGGVRLSATTGRVDWSVSGYRGYEPFALYSLTATRAAPGAPFIAQEYPRYTMVGGDFESVRGEWGIRGELAAFVRDNFQSPDLRVVPGSSIDAGVGVDRRAGDYTISATVLAHAESYDTPLAAADPRDGRSDVSFVFSTDRTFARERYRLRGFGVYNATEGSGFLRAIGMASLRDNVALEGSIGWFAGEGRDLVGRFGDSDFAYVRVKYYF